MLYKQVKNKNNRINSEKANIIKPTGTIKSAKNKQKRVNDTNKRSDGTSTERKLIANVKKKNFKGGFKRL